MKMKSKIITAILLLCLFEMGAQADIVLQDNFDSYATGDLTNVSGMFWTSHSGTNTQPMYVVADDSVSTPNALQVSRSEAQDDNAPLTGAPYYSAGTNAFGVSVDALYFKFTLRMSSSDLPTASGTYFAHLKDTTSSGFRARVIVSTSGAAAGDYKIGIANASSTPVNWGADLVPDTTYVIVVRYTLATGYSTLWVNPASESDTSVTGADTPSLLNISTMAFRQSSGEGTMNIDDLVVGTSFSDVLSGKPLVVHEPEDKISFAGGAASFSAGVFGASPLTYQWYYNTNTLLTDSTSVIGANSNILTLNNLSLEQAGTYDCVITNVYGTNITRYVLLTVNEASISPVITNQPAAGSTNIAGDNVTISVVAGGVPPPSYQWKVIVNGVTNDVTGANVSGANTDTLTLTGVTTDQSGVYFATITNIVGSTNSSLFTLLVNPPPTTDIADLRALVDPGTLIPTNSTSIYVTEGIVTSWTNMSSSSGSEFYMQDDTAGIVVYWAGAPGAANLPPAGARVRVTAPLSSFNGLLELAPVASNPQTSVQILSTNNPLPAAQPLPFDPNIVNNPAIMERLEGTYFVASNVTLTAGDTFIGGSNEALTNNAHHVLSDGMFGINFTNEGGQTITLYVNYYTDVQDQPKYKGPVTIFGVLGSYKGLYEFTPTRYADIISYTRLTNIVTNVKHYGDLLTNSYSENVLRPGETQTTIESIGDPEGGSVTLTPVTSGLPAGASWSNVTNGSTGTAIFHFTPSSTDSGSNYTVSLAATSSSGGNFTNSFTVYVPTLDEQKVAISEFLANPTTDVNAPNFNPLHRTSDTVGISTNDEYIEIANQSANSVDLFAWQIFNGDGTVLQDYSIFGGTLSPMSSRVIYGGPADGSDAPNISGTAEQATTPGLGLTKAGTGSIILRNGAGYIVDRVVYSASDLSTNGSLTRFPTIDSRFVPQPYVSTNLNTPGEQYDGVSWASPTSVPRGINDVSVSVTNNQVFLNFTADTTKASTLWRADSLTDPFIVVNGGQFGSSSATFTETNIPSKRFYFITTQQ